MAAENEHVGDCVEDIEDVEEEETGVNRVLNLPGVLAAIQQQRAMLLALPPKVKRRIKALKKLQLEQTHVEAKFFDEVHELECKYHHLYLPLYEKRETIVSGGHEPTEEECDFPSDDDDEEIAKETEEKMKIEEGLNIKAEVPPMDENVSGIPDFWLTIFKNIALLAEMVQEYDEPILKHLKDIKTRFLEKPMGFTLEFHFAPNEYFTNTVLTKEYDMKCVPDTEDPFGFEGPEIYKCRGCQINWMKGKNVTLKLVKKKQKHKSRGLVRTITKTVQNDSFFNFFNPPTIPDDINADDVDDELRELLTTDFEIGHYIRERVVPKAVLYYTGEAIDDEEYDDEEDEDDDDDDTEEEGDSDNKENAKTAKDQNCKQQ